MPATAPATSARLRLGFIALTDAAPVIVAREHGFFRRHGLEVELTREAGWATIRDKILHRELDAAHALAPMPLAASLGLQTPAHACLSACVLSRNGNAITLSAELWKHGVRDAATLRDHIVRLRHERRLVLGVVHPHSSHHILLLDWLAAAGIHPLRDVRIVIVPPAQLFRNLSAGTLDGYCAGEPWGSLAIREGAGWCAALSRDLHPGHVEKVLMVRADFAEENHERHLALVAAVADAVRLCDEPGFRPELVRLLSHRACLNVPERVIASALIGPFQLGHARTRDAADLVSFGDPEPDPRQAAWLLEGLQRHGLLASAKPAAGLVRAVYRPDLHRLALKSVPSLRHDQTLVHA